MYKCRYCVLNTGYWVLELTNVVYLFPWKQADNGLPVHIKGGTVDVLMYRATMTLTMAGNSLSYLFTYSSIIYIHICLLSVHLSIIYVHMRLLSMHQYVYYLYNNTYIIHMHMSIIYIHICLLSIHLYVYYLYTYTSIIYIHMSFNYTPICILSIYI